MKLEQTYDIDLGESDAEVLVGGIDPQGWSIIFESLLNYSRPKESLVREIASNCRDSHREASIIKAGASDEYLMAMGYLPEELDQVREYFSKWEEEPFEVIMQQENKLTGSEQAIIFRDNGVGLSPRRIEKTYLNIAGSTKRATNDLLGAFGIGSKSPLGYRDEFTVVTRYFGTEYYYIVRKAKKGLELDRLAVLPTDKPNGTDVVVAIRQGDWHGFQSAIQQQLAYFPDVRFSGCEVKDGIIYRGENFVYRTNSPFDKMHLAIEDVYYPIDFGAVDLPRPRTGYSYSTLSYTIPLGLRFTLDEIGFAIMEKRENIQYTPRVQTLIKEKLETVREELKNLHDSKFEHIDSMKKYVEATMAYSSNKSLEIADGVFLPKVDELIDVRPTYPKYAKLRQLPNDPFPHWKLHRKVSDGSNDYIKKREQDRSALHYIRNGERIYIAPDNQMSKKTSGFICWSEGDFVTIEEKDPGDYWKYRIFGHEHNSPSDEVVRLVSSFLSEASEYLREKYPSYDDVQITNAYEEYLKEERERLRSLKPTEVADQNEKITFRSLVLSNEAYYSNRLEEAFQFEMDDVYVRQIARHTGVVVYGFQDDAEKLIKLAPIFFVNSDLLKDKENWTLYSHRLRLNNRVWVGKIAQSNEKYFQENPNAMHVDTFIKSKSPLIRRWLTAQHLSNLESLQGYESLTSSRVREIAPKAHKAAWFVQKYLTTYHATSYWTRALRYDDDLLQGCLDLFKEEELFDDYALQQASYIEAFFTKYPLLRGLPIQNVDLNEVAFYMNAKGHVNPWLYHRFIKWKQEKEDRKLIANVEEYAFSGDGQATDEPVLTEVDTTV